MGATYGLNTIQKKEFTTYDYSDVWLRTIGAAERNFRMIIWGPSGSGKTTFAFQLCKELARHGKVYYNSVEQGVSKSLQDTIERCDLSSVGNGRVMIGDRDTFDEMFEKIKKLRAQFVFIDSAQYIELTTTRYKRLVRQYPRKSFIIISWEADNKEPKGEYAKAIRYMVDIKCRVHDGLAVADSRFGETAPYRVFPAKETTLGSNEPKIIQLRLSM
ncbi:MAG: ATP-binding protein [Prolixibacteraceae bacterium]|nr:ATP-binding protein [Prolixibacteraceae bacterium]